MTMHGKSAIRLLYKQCVRLTKIDVRCLSSKEFLLHEALQVQKISDDVFLQSADRLIINQGGNVFGGQMVGSAMNAAQHTLDKALLLHSLQSYFVNAADNSSNLVYRVLRLRDGKSFATRTVTATQNERIIFQCSVSFHQKERGNMRHQLARSDSGRLHYAI
jgi:acyl-CoA thioesterase II